MKLLKKVKTYNNLYILFIGLVSKEEFINGIFNLLEIEDKNNKEDLLQFNNFINKFFEGNNNKISFEEYSILLKDGKKINIIKKYITNLELNISR